MKCNLKLKLKEARKKAFYLAIKNKEEVFSIVLNSLIQELNDVYDDLLDLDFIAPDSSNLKKLAKIVCRLKQLIKNYLEVPK